MKVNALLVVVALGVSAAAQEQRLAPVERPVPPGVEWLADAPPGAGALAASPAAWGPLLERNGLSLDVEGRSLAIRGATLHDATSLAGQSVEYLVVTERGRTHEALFLVKAQPSLVDACLRALGLPTGSPMRYVSKEPPPTAKELEAGAEPWVLVAPSGELVDVRVAWTDADGKAHEIPLESALIDVRTGEALEDRDWVYTGGGFGALREGRRVLHSFLADLQGDVIGISPLDRGGEGACVLERNSKEGVDDTLYALNEKQAPPRGTPVTLLLRPVGRRVVEAESPQPEVVVHGDVGARLDAWLARAQAWGFSGVVLAESGGEVLLHKGYGLADPAAGTPLNTATVFPLGALGRQFTVAAVIQLVAVGKLSLDDLVDVHLERVPEDKVPITVGMLLRHASGLPATMDAPSGAEAATLGADRRATVARILATPLVAPPGTPGPAGLDDALLAAVVESAADDIWRGYVGEHLFAPAALTSAGLLGEPRWPADRLAHGRLGAPGAQVAAPPPWDGPLTWQALGTGAVACTVRDVHRWLLSLEDGVILSDDVRALFFSPATSSWTVTEGGPHGPVASAVGTTPGYRVEVRRWRETGATLIVAQNSELAGVAEPLAALLFGGEVASPPAVTEREDDATALIGEWRGAGVALRLVAPASDAGTLWAVPADQATLDLLDGAEASLRSKFGMRTVAVVVAVANRRWDEAAGALGPGVTPAGAEAALGGWWSAVSAGLGKPVEPRVLAVGAEDGALAVDVELVFEKGSAERRVLWRDGALADVRLPGAALGTRRLLPAKGGGWASWSPAEGAGAALAAGPNEGVLVLTAKNTSVELRRAP